MSKSIVRTTSENYPASQYNAILEHFNDEYTQSIALVKGSPNWLAITRALELAEWIENHRDCFRSDPAHDANARGMLEMLRTLRGEV